MSEPNLTILDNFIQNPQALFNDILHSVVGDERMRSRRTASFGVAYNYSGITYPQTEMLPVLQPLCEQLIAIVGFRPNNCLLNHYPDGEATMGFHSDDLAQLVVGTGVAIV